MTIQQRKTKIRINPEFDSSTRKAIASDVIIRILKRSDEGLGVSGQPDDLGLYTGTENFPKYTPEYIRSEEFRRAGKTSTVDLKLSKRMLADLQLLDDGEGFIELGFKNPKENAKAEGNIIGSYGRTPNASKARNFLGITTQEYEEIVSPYAEKLNLDLLLFIPIGDTDREEDENIDFTIFDELNNGS